MDKSRVADEPILIENGTLDRELESNLPVITLIWRGESLRSDLSTALKTVAKENAGRIRVLKVDVSSDPELEERFGLGKHPLIIGWYQGDPKARRSRPWGTDVTGIAADLLELVPEEELPDLPEEEEADTLPDDKPVHVTDETFVEDVIESPLPVIIDFWAEWCQPCKMIAPVLEKLAAEFAGQIRVAKVDVDSNPFLAQQFQIRSIPTLMFVKNGKIVGQTAGVPQQAEMALRDVIQQLITLQV